MTGPPGHEEGGHADLKASKTSYPFFRTTDQGLSPEEWRPRCVYHEEQLETPKFYPIAFLSKPVLNFNRLKEGVSIRVPNDNQHPMGSVKSPSTNPQAESLHILALG